MPNIHHVTRTEELIVSLTGALEAFPLPDVLQLLTRSRKSGMLRVMAKGLEGRVYFAEGELTYGATGSDDELGADAVRAGLLDEEAWLRVERQEASLTDAAGVPEGEVQSFVAEHVYDALFRLLRLDRGNFEFIADMRPRYDTGQTISTDGALAEADKRLSEWRGIEAVIPGMSFRLTVAPSLGQGQDEVTIDADSWRVLAGLRGVGTVEELAARLGSTDFQVAKTMAGLVREGVVVVVDQVAGAEERVETGEPRPEISIVRDAPPDDEPQAVEDETVEGEEEEREEGDEASLLRVALSGVVNLEADEDPAAEDEQEEEPDQPVLRRRGLGSIAREWRSE